MLQTPLFSRVTQVSTLSPHFLVRLFDTFVLIMLRSFYHILHFILEPIDLLNDFKKNLYMLIFTLCAVKVNGFWQIHSVMYSGFTTLKINTLCFHLFNTLAICPNPWQPLIFLHCYGFAFPDWCILEIIKCVSFSGWILLLSNVHLRFIYAFLWLEMSFLLSVLTKAIKGNYSEIIQRE